MHSYKVTNPALVADNGSYYYGNNKQNSHELSEYDKGSNKSPPVIDEGEQEEEDRGRWGSKAEFILSCIGFSVGIGNVWRFPYLAYQNGGAAFLIPYVILMALVGKPLYYLETAMGQFARTSPVHIWQCAPIATGVGFAMLVVSLMVTIYYNVIMAYSVVYIGASFQGITHELPWSNCSSWWGASENCTLITEWDKSDLKLQRCRPVHGITENCTYQQTPTSEFWERYVLNITDGLSTPGDLGGFDYHLPLSLLLSWVVVFFCLMKGVKSSGKVVYFTATFPYVILIILLVCGLLSDGAMDGLRFLFVPVWSKLLSFTVWVRAAEQMFFSLGISWGGLIMFGSYNKFHNRIDLDAALISVVDLVTSIISSCVIFSILGVLSKELDVDIKSVATEGPGLAFVVYPEALSRLPVPWLWSLLFFVMLFFLGLDSEFALLETILTVLYDAFPVLRRHKVKMTFFACATCYLLGIPCVSKGGNYVLDIMNTYGAGFPVTWIAFCEVVAFMWIYGYKNVCRDFELMLKSKPSPFWRLAWVVFAPITLLVLSIASAVTWGQPLYANSVPYPEWAHNIGWTLAILSIIQVPIWAVIMTIHYAIKGDVTQVFRPTPEWGPGDDDVRRAILDQQSGIVRSRHTGRHAYDNPSMTGYM